MSAGPLPLPPVLQLEGDRVICRLCDESGGEATARLGDNSICLRIEGEAGGGRVIWVEAAAPCQLEIDTGFTTFVEQVPAGCTRYLLTHLDRTDVRQV